MKPRTWADGNPTGALRRAYELSDELDAIKAEREKSNSGLIIYTKDNCAQCKVTKLHLTNLGLTYTERNTDTNLDYLAEAKATGYTSMPIVVVDGRVIASGFQPDRLNELTL